jgi:hypothetical protein
MRIFKNRIQKDLTWRVSVINKDGDKCRKYKRLLFEAAVYLKKIGEKQMADLFNDSIEPMEYAYWEVVPFRQLSKDEERRKNHAIAGLAELITVTAREMVFFKRKHESDPVKLYLNGEVLEQFSICGDSPQAALFDAMQAVIRHKGRIL